MLKKEMNIKFMKLAESRQLDWTGRGAPSGFNGAGVPMPPATNDTSSNYGGASVAIPSAGTTDATVRTISTGECVEKAGAVTA